MYSYMPVLCKLDILTNRMLKYFLEIVANEILMNNKHRNERLFLMI